VLVFLAILPYNGLPHGMSMTVASHFDERLIQAYRVLRELVEQVDENSVQESAVAFLPALPPIDPGSRLSATDLLSSWFRPPSGHPDPWQNFFHKYESPAQVTPPSSQPAGPAAMSVAAPRAVARALFPEPEDELSSETADAAVEVLYEFLHAFGRRDVERAMQFVAADYHTFADDREINRDDLRNYLEALLESFRGWEFEVSLSMAPEPIEHPYGIIVYAEIQIDAVHSESKAKRNVVERRLVLLQAQEDSEWRLASLSPVRLGRL
jgi:ketosteroid isomerase-like protein